MTKEEMIDNMLEDVISINQRNLFKMQAMKKKKLVVEEIYKAWLKDKANIKFFRQLIIS